MTQASITVVAGPTAVGKGTVISRLREMYPQIYYSVSATTRLPRPGEIDGVHYHFVSQKQFASLVEQGQMLEWALVHGLNSYGTMRSPIMEAVAAGKPALIEVDLAGARQIRQSLPEAKQIFIAPPTFADLEERLAKRGTEGPAERIRRLETAREEMAAQNEFDLVIVNHTVDLCAHNLAQAMGLE
ncbi:guanylate kinase [Actinomycetaceae bacterium TAE3-ERU4]|nr:guanylate kinase [Actinomycetaceae bacterium TAE3-ERU4]